MKSWRKYSRENRMEKTGKKAGVAVRLLLVGAAVCLLAAGTARGEVRTVLTKAANICMECIGIG